MKVLGVFINSKEQWVEQHVCFSGIKEAREILCYRAKATLIWVEEDISNDHEWEQIDEEYKMFQCKCCGMPGRREGTEIRVAWRQRNIFYDFGCAESRLLANMPHTAKWAQQVKNEGFAY